MFKKVLRLSLLVMSTGGFVLVALARQDAADTETIHMNVLKTGTASPSRKKG